MTQGEPRTRDSRDARQDDSAPGAHRYLQPWRYSSRFPPQLTLSYARHASRRLATAAWQRRVTSAKATHRNSRGCVAPGCLAAPPTPRPLECSQASLGSPWPLPLLSLPAWTCGHAQPPRSPAVVLSMGGHQPSLRPPMFEGLNPGGASSLPSNPLEAPDQHPVTLGLPTSE